MSAILSQSKGGHNYGRDDSSTNDCLLGCGAWMGGCRSGAPDGIDPFGKCPNNPKNKKEKGDVKVLTAKSLIGKKLDEFTIQEYTEVYKTDVEGRGKEKSLGYFKDDGIAKAFAGNQIDSAWHKTVRVLLLTDGKVGFLLGDSVKLLDDEKASLEIKQSALAKLSPEERKVLGI